jgi:hypothetical protein
MLESVVNRLIIKLLHKKLNRCLLTARSVLDLFGSTYELYDDARYAREGE